MKSAAEQTRRSGAPAWGQCRLKRRAFHLALAERRRLIPRDRLFVVQLLLLGLSCVSLLSLLGGPPEQFAAMLEVVGGRCVFAESLAVSLFRVLSVR